MSNNYSESGFREKLLDYAINYVISNFREKPESGFWEKLRDYAISGFWEKLRDYAIVAGREVVERALMLYYAAQAPETPMEAKTVIYGALAYFILPADLVSDFIPVAGYVDDLGVLFKALATVAAYITPEIEEKAKRKAAEWFGDTGRV